MTILLFALVLFSTKANAQVMPFGMLHSNVDANAPTITNVVPGDGQVTVTFDHPEANGGATSTGYTVTSSQGGKTVTGQNSPIIITGLTNGTLYTFTVTTTNSAGQSATSAASSAVMPTPTLAEDEVYNPTTNKIWKDRNLGASKVAESSIDEDSYGDLYQWGRGADGHQERNSGITPGPSTSHEPGANFLTRQKNLNWYSGTDPKANDLWIEDGAGVNDPCPIGFRLPTIDEWIKETENWDYYKSGSTGDNESATGSGPFTSSLKLPRSGWRKNIDGEIFSIGTQGFYWSSTINIETSKPFAVSFNSGADQQAAFDGAFGFSVRCIKHEE